VLRLQQAELRGHEKDQEITILKAEVERWKHAHDSMQAGFAKASV